MEPPRPLSASTSTCWQGTISFAHLWLLISLLWEMPAIRHVDASILSIACVVYLVWGKEERELNESRKRKCRNSYMWSNIPGLWTNKIRTSSTKMLWYMNSSLKHSVKLTKSSSPSSDVFEQNISFCLAKDWIWRCSAVIVSSRR